MFFIKDNTFITIQGKYLKEEPVSDVGETSFCLQALIRCRNQRVVSPQAEFLCYSFSFLWTGRGSNRKYLTGTFSEYVGPGRHQAHSCLCCSQLNKARTRSLYFLWIRFSFISPSLFLKASTATPSPVFQLLSYLPSRLLLWAFTTPALSVPCEISHRTFTQKPHPYHRAKDKHRRVCHASMHIHR